MVNHYCPVEGFGLLRNSQLLQDLIVIPAFFDLNS